MAQQTKIETSPGKPRGDRVLVEDEDGQRPFMRGIMVHSLMARGVSFEDAFKAANAAREQTRGRGVIPRSELRKLVSELVGDQDLSEHQPPISIPRALEVGEGEDVVPFSKGVLSQSLLASSIDPSDAFDVAREIESDLLRGGRRSIARRELRLLAYERLHKRFGSRTASRYRIWRQFQEPERPVIILLGGSSGVGKTSLALEVSRRLGISRVLSTDSIRQVMRMMLSPELMPAIHCSSFDAHLHMPQTVENGEATDPVVRGFMAQASVVSVGVRAMIDRAVAENTSLVLDGVSLAPGSIDFEEYRDRAHIIYLVVARLDEKSLSKQFNAREKRQSHRNATRYVENLSGILKIQDHFLELADHHDIPIVDNVTLDGSVMLVIRHVVETLRKTSGIDEAELH